MSRRVHFVSLGCPKNRVDSEVMLGLLGQANYEIVPEPDNADVIVVNTCAFIDQAKAESVQTILEMARYKDEGNCDTLMVAGCLSQRYPKELADEMPEVDHFLGTADYRSVVDILRKRESGIGIAARTQVGIPDFAGSSTLPRARTQPAYSQYLKISEGCSNKCAFCIIPTLRGLQKSRGIDDLVIEAERLAKAGATELNLIGQDLTAYGFDLPGRPKLTHLLDALSGVSGVKWLRLMYAYPRTFNTELIRHIADSPKVLPYIDMPLQHIADDMLRGMKRGVGEKEHARCSSACARRCPSWSFARPSSRATRARNRNTSKRCGTSSENSNSIASACSRTRKKKARLPRCFRKTFRMRSRSSVSRS